MLYPLMNRYVQDRQKVSMLEQWSSVRDQTLVPLAAAVPLQPTLLFNQGALEEAGVEKPEQADETVNIDGYAVRGIMMIDKLELKEPIVEGADPEALKTGIGIVEPDRYPGGTGNFVVAGHRSWTYGKQFSRLNELESGDRIVVETTKHVYSYTVTSKFLVQPDDLSVLEQKKDKAEMTLITCEPKYNPTHRLIVKAVLEGDPRSIE
ncbi:class D sortase [Paenibacillus sp. OAS669]|uniref:class D sortase n=1 Tax=Paenibacillus sp. OAS669 TaxID=2663821 RepID=UPI00178BB2E2|nr:class D sortase [Paenibacillus sp. OAS669]MBE1445172.1 sortase A [Paenibacillus sp. OAS669]